MDKRRPRRSNSYWERNYEWWYVKPRKKVCHVCRISFSKNTHCTKCKRELIPVSYRAKIPRKNASNATWKRFWLKHNEWCGKNPHRRKCYGDRGARFIV